MGWSTHHPVGLIYHSPQHCYRGYTLLCTGGGQHAYLIDMEGRVCHRWHSPEGIEYAYLLPNGHLLLRTNRTAPPRDNVDRMVDVGNKGRVAIETIGGSSSTLQELDWEGNLVWEFRNPMVHHDFRRLPNGNTLVLLFERMPAELSAQVRGGFTTDNDPRR